MKILLAARIIGIVYEIVELNIDLCYFNFKHKSIYKIAFIGEKTPTIKLHLI